MRAPLVLGLALGLAVSPTSLRAEPTAAVRSAIRGTVNARTLYDDDADTFVTRGWVGLEVPLPVLARIAGDFAAYRTWALHDINKKPDGENFITQMHDVRFTPGGAGPEGAFDLYFDIDLVWPFGSEGNIMRFAVVEARHRPDGGVDRIVARLYGDSALLDDFRLTLEATGDDKASVVRFDSRVKVDGFFDTFFTLATYRRNVEWRIVKVIQNLEARVAGRAR